MHDNIRPLACALATLALAGTAHAQSKNAGQPACKLEAAGIVTVRSVTDGRTVLLTDGREVRLAGIEVASPENATGAEARLALENFIANQEITLKRPASAQQTDRYGRLVAFAFIPGSERSAQHALLAQGHARVSARVGDAGCATELLNAERAARAARLGIWGNHSYVMRQADNPAAVLADRGRFAVVEGKVVSVREFGATIYVNFGRRWTEDFTVTVAKRSEGAFTAAGLELRKLTGRHVRVRGTIEERGGPWIEASRPEQIEIAERN